MSIPSRSMCLPLVALFVLAPEYSTAQDTNSIQLTLPWKAGDEFRFDRTTKITNVVQGQVREGTGKRAFDLKILRSDTNGYLVAMRYGKPTIEGEFYTSDPFTLHFNELASRFEYEFELDRTGLPIDLANWQKIQDGLQKAVDDLEAEFQGKDPAGVPVNKQNLIAMFADKEQVIDRARRDFEVLTLPYFRRYLVGTTEGELVEPDPADTTPRVYKRTYLAEHAPAQAERLQLTLSEVIDVDATRAYYARRRREGASDNEILLFQALDGILAQMDSRQTTVYTLETVSGRLLEATNTLTEQSGETVNISELAFRVHP